MNDLFPRPPKRMRQPKKDLLREQLAIAASENEFWRTKYLQLFDEQFPRPWWRRIFAQPAKFKPRKKP